MSSLALEGPVATSSLPGVAPGVIFAGRFQLERESQAPAESGPVYDATDLTSHKHVTIALASRLPDPKAQTRFVRDAMVVQRLEGEHVLRVLDVGAAQGVPYVVREPAISTLAAEVRARGAIVVTQAVAWTLEVAEALAEAHAIGMAHGHVDLDHVCLARSSRPEEGAIAKLAWTEVERSERATREDVARDVAALGMLLRSLLTGAAPGSDAEEAPTLPSDLAHAVARAATPDEAARFRNVAELSRAIAAFAPPGHKAARNVSFTLSRAGIVGATIPSPARPSTDDAAFDGAGSSVFSSLAGRSRARSLWAAGLAALAVMGAILGATLAVVRGRLASGSPRDSSIVGTTDLTSAEVIGHSTSAERAGELTAEAILTRSATLASPVDVTEAASTAAPVQSPPEVVRSAPEAPAIRLVPRTDQAPLTLSAGPVVTTATAPNEEAEKEATSEDDEARFE